MQYSVYFVDTFNQSINQECTFEVREDEMQSIRMALSEGSIEVDLPTGRITVDANVRPLAEYMTLAFAVGIIFVNMRKHPFTPVTTTIKVFKIIWQRAASPSYNPSRWRMHSFAAFAGQAHSPAAAGEQCILMHRYVTMDRHVSPQKCPFPWEDLDQLFNTRFLGPGPTRVCPPNGISISSAVLYRSHRQHTHRHTEKQTTLRASSVKIGRIYALRAGDAAE